LGYNIPAVSHSSEDALERVKEHQPNLIMIDLVLNGKLGGVKAAETIAAMYHVPIIFITSHDDDDSFTKANLSAPFGYVTKPFATRDLRDTIELTLLNAKMNATIKSSSLHYQAIMENASCGILIHDVNGIITDINHEAEKIIGAPKSEIIGLDFKKFVVKEEQEYADVQFHKLVIEKNIGPNIGHMQKPDGGVIDLEFSSTYVESGDEPFIVSIINDVTDSNKLRTQALLNDKLRTLGTIATGIIHEINNPMTWILSNLDYFKNKLKILKVNDIEQENIIQKLDQMTDESIEGAERIRNIVKDLKGFVRVDKNAYELVNVEEIINSAINMSKPQFKNDAKVELHFSPDLPLLFLDKSKLQQVFLNLIINAIQAMTNNKRQRDKIDITTRLFGDDVIIDIQDVGKGISPDVMSKIFDPFFTTKPIGLGTGLGLSICNDIISGFGGEIKVKSVLGEGTTFSVYLPAHLLVNSPTQMPSEISKELTRKKILVVDDEPSILAVINRILSNHEVTQCDGRAALDHLVKKGAYYEVIISDLNMPDVSGIDLYRYAAKYLPGLEKKIIFITGGSYTSEMSEFMALVENTFLEKPFSPVQLIQAVDKMSIKHEVNERQPK